VAHQARADHADIQSTHRTSFRNRDAANPLVNVRASLFRNQSARLFLNAFATLFVNEASSVLRNEVSSLFLNRTSKRLRDHPGHHAPPQK
jgi:hypothetical protein